MTRKTRTIITDFGGELEAMIQDNRMTAAPVAPARKPGAATRARAGKAKSAAKPLAAGQGAATGAARKNHSIRVPFHDPGMVAQARELAAQYGIPEARALAPQVKKAAAILRERLEAGALDGLEIGHDRRRPIASVATSISLSDADLAAIRARVDPAGIYSNAKVLALTFAQILGESAG